MSDLHNCMWMLGDELVANELRPQFVSLFHERFADQMEDLFFHLRTHYVTRERHYHTLEHIKACIDVIDACPLPKLLGDHEWCLTVDAHRLAKLALFYHDIVYNVRRRDNEEQSVRIFQITAGPLCSRQERQLVSEAILATAHGTETIGRMTIVSQLVIDADLSILGENPETYDAYVAKIRKEYAFVSDADWRIGRAKVLKRFRYANPLYWRESMRDRYEAQAHANLERELKSLG